MRINLIPALIIIFVSSNRGTLYNNSHENPSQQALKEYTALPADERAKDPGFIMEIITENRIIDNILNSYKPELGKDFEQYKNHVYRVFNFAVIQTKTKEEYGILSISAAFHDIGIWTDNTFDYLQASVNHAYKYCANNSVSEEISKEIEIIINNHHKITRCRSSYLAEIFRQADLTDLTFGLFHRNSNMKFVQKSRKYFHNEGFHLNLLKLFIINLTKEPWDPLPMYRW